MKPSDTPAKTHLRMVALILVEQRKITQIVASGCYWKDDRGDPLERGMGRVLTHLRQKELIVSDDHPSVRFVRLTPKGRAVLRMWRKYT